MTDPIAVMSLLAAHDVHYVVNLEDASDSLGGKGNGACGDEKWLDYILFQDVGDSSFSHIDPCRFLSLGMPAKIICLGIKKMTFSPLAFESLPIPQFCHSGYGVEASVLRQSVRNNFHGVGKLLKN